MKKVFSVYIIIILHSFLLWSCDEGNAKKEKWIQEQIKIILNSADTSKIIACYNELTSFSVLKFTNNDRTIALKTTYRKDYPVFVDSLHYIKHNEFKSQRLNTTYLIKDKTIILIQYVKIIHPSSNWQGQTPWTQPYVTIYKKEGVFN